MADTTQTIQSFYQIATERDFARKFNFRILSIDPGDATNVSYDENDLVYVRTAQLPAREITEVTVPYMGLDFHIPGTVKYPGSEAYSMEFYCDSNSKIRQNLKIGVVMCLMISQAQEIIFHPNKHQQLIWFNSTTN